MMSAERRTHRDTLQWALEAEDPGTDHVMGIMGRSVFFDVPGFDIIRDMIPEPMHLLDAGFMKTTCGRAFNSGTAHQTQPGYRRTNIAILDSYVK